MNKGTGTHASIHDLPLVIDPIRSFSVDPRRGVVSYRTKSGLWKPLAEVSDYCLLHIKRAMERDKLVGQSCWNIIMNEAARRGIDLDGLVREE